MPEPETISNPRRILAVSLEDATPHLTHVIKDLSGSSPEQVSTTLAGTTHDLNLSTAYYNATVPIWIDLIASPAEWAASFLSEEAKEVLSVIGGLILIFPVAEAGKKATREVIEEVGKVVKDGLGGWEWDGVGLAVGVGNGDIDEWDELCAEVGLEFVQVTGNGGEDKRNEFGEKTGISRVKEALEANDWASLDDPALSDFGDFEEEIDEDLGKEQPDPLDFDPERLDFGFDKADFEGLRKAIWTSETGTTDQPDKRSQDPHPSSGEPSASTMVNDEKKAQGEAKKETGGSLESTEKFLQGNSDLDDEEVLKVERMMRKLVAVREAGESMGPEQRRRMAARAVEDVMKDL